MLAASFQRQLKSRDMQFLTSENDDLKHVGMECFHYHHQICSMNNLPLFRVRSWNNGVCCMSFCILMVTRHFNLTTGSSMVDRDALYTRQFPTKVIVGLVSNEAFTGAWQKNPFNFTHMDLNSACLVVDGQQLQAQPWQPDFEGGL